jgi:RNA polymerase sigma factor (sigma-70 family)
MATKQEDWGATRRTLLERLKNWEDQASWEDFFHSYGKLLYAVARQAGLTNEEAEDVVQETVLTVSKNIKEFQYDPRRGSFKAWLLHTTRWRIADQFRKRPAAGGHRIPSSGDTRRTRTTDRIADPAGSELERLWDAEWVENLRHAALDRVKRKVKAKHYQIFDLSVLKNWPVERITRTLGVSSTQVYLARHRIGLLLRQEIKRLEAKPI